VHARTRAAVVFVVAGAFTTAVAQAGPGDVYNDFVQDGKLNCNHSRADLEGVLRSGSINQYGDPLTLMRLKLAVRRQLAGGCSASARSSAKLAEGQTNGATTTSSASGPAGHTNGAGKHQPKHESGQAKRAATSATGVNAATSKPGEAGFLSGRVLIAVLFAGAVAITGWLTRRALIRRN
jgi:cobalamin biosynthesis Mg chelatase CobN